MLFLSICYHPTDAYRSAHTNRSAHTYRSAHTTFEVREPKGNIQLGNMFSFISSSGRISNVLRILMNKNTDAYTRSEKYQIIEATKQLKVSKPDKSFTICTFSVKTKTIETGFCTRFGACRFQGSDYMYQVGPTKYS